MKSHVRKSPPYEKTAHGPIGGIYNATLLSPADKLASSLTIREILP